MCGAVEIDELIGRLASTDAATFRHAHDALVELGAPAVGPVLAALCDPAHPVDSVNTGSVLVHIGEPAFGPLIEAIDSAPSDEAMWRARYVFDRLRIDPSRVAPALSHPNAVVRAGAAYQLQVAGERAAGHTREIIPLLADPDADVRDRVKWVLKEIGPQAVPALREVRRAKGAGRLRRPALLALTEIGGFGALDEHDQAVIRRLIDLKIPEDEPDGMHLCGSWFALPTGDQPAVLDAFGLADPVPVTMALGASVWNADHHTAPADVYVICSRVYVSPAFEGWTLVFGLPCEDNHRLRPREDDFSESFHRVIEERLAALSRRFGEAHWYGTSCGDGWEGWGVAEDGAVIRLYDGFHPELSIGSPLPAEDGYILPHEDFEDDDERPLCEAVDIAGQLSVNPEDLDFLTDFEGHAVLGHTPCATQNPHPPGIFTI